MKPSVDLREWSTEHPIFQREERVNLEEAIREFRDLSESASKSAKHQTAEVYSAVARMLDTVAQDITIEHHSARKAEESASAILAWENAARKLGVAL